MSVEELWRARVEGRFGLKHYVKAWIISTRAFALPWAVGYALFGALLAGVSDWSAALGACITVSLVLLAGHFINNYRDVERGVDPIVSDPEEARKIISSIKPYTAAAWIVPLQITSIRFQKASAVAMLLLSMLAYCLLVPKTLYTLVFYVIGVFMAISYTDFWKPKRIGEAAAFIGHGFATTAFGYLAQSPDILNAMLAGVVPGFISALAYSVDQYLDIKTDFVERVRSIAEAWFNSRLPLGLYVLAIVAFLYHLLTAWVALGIYPKGVLLAYILLPFYLLTIARVEYDREKGVRDAAVLTTIALPLIMCVGVLLGF